MIYLFFAAPYIIISAISGFKKNHSTLSQRVWMMLWIAYPSFLTLFILGPLEILSTRLQDKFQFGIRRLWRVCKFLWFLTSACVAVGGLVTMSKMILESGMCELY